MSRASAYLGFLTSALVHGNLIHIFFNLSSILNLPSFLPSALGSGLFLATFLISTLTGNVAHMMTTPSTPVLGASGGICGLYGILYVLFSSSNRKQEAKGVLKSMGFLLLMGYLYRGVSNSSHIGGFIGGALVGWASGPRFRKSYRSKRDPGDTSGIFSDRKGYNPALRSIAGRMEVREPRVDWRVIMGTGIVTATFIGGLEGVRSAGWFATKVFTTSGYVSGVKWFQ